MLDAALYARRFPWRAVALALAVERRRCGDGEVAMATDLTRGRATAQRRRRSRQGGRRVESFRAAFARRYEWAL
jgi:hypothetical protein